MSLLLFLLPWLDFLKTYYKEVKRTSFRKIFGFAPKPFSSPGCEQSLFCSKIRGTNAKGSARAGVRATLVSWLRRSQLTNRAPSLFFAFAPRISERKRVCMNLQDVLIGFANTHYLDVDESISSPELRFLLVTWSTNSWQK